MLILQFFYSILFYLEFGKENLGYGVTRTIHHLDVMIKCKIEWRKDTKVSLGLRGCYKDPKDKWSIWDNPPITTLTCVVKSIRDFTNESVKE